jgi:hypothetical protein
MLPLPVFLEDKSLSCLLEVSIMDVCTSSARATVVLDEVKDSVMAIMPIAATTPFKSAFRIQYFQGSGLGLGALRLEVGGWRLGVGEMGAEHERCMCMTCRVCLAPLVSIRVQTGQILKHHESWCWNDR